MWWVLPDVMFHRGSKWFSVDSDRGFPHLITTAVLSRYSKLYGVRKAEIRIEVFLTSLEFEGLVFYIKTAFCLFHA